MLELLFVLPSDEELLVLLGSLVAVELESTLPLVPFVGSFEALEPLSSLDDAGSLLAFEPFVLVVDAPLLVFIVVPSVTVLPRLSFSPSFAVLLDDGFTFTLPVVAAVDGALIDDEPPLSLPLVIIRPLPAPLPYPPIEP